MSDFVAGFLVGGTVAAALALIAAAGPLERWWVRRQNPPLPDQPWRPVHSEAPRLLLLGPGEEEAS